MEAVPRRNWIAVMGGLIGAFMAILDIQITNASLKDIQGALSATLSESSWISTSYLVAEMIAIPLSGWLSRGLSVRRYLLWTTGAFIFSSVLCSFSWNLTSMIVFRAMQGFTGGALIPMAFSLIISLLPLHKRATGMALFGLCATFAPAIGPTLGGWLTEQLSWHYIFYLNVPPGLLVMAMLAHGLDRKAIDWTIMRQVDLVGILTMAVGLGLLEVVLEEGNREDWFGSSFIVKLTLISVVALIFFVMSQLLRRHPLVNLRLLHNPRFALACFAYLVLGMALMGSIYVLPLYMAQIHNYNALEIGEVLMWMGLPQLLVLPLVPKLIQKIDPRYLVSFGFLIFGLSCFMNVNMSADYAGPQLIQSLIVRALGQPFVMVPLSLIATASLTQDEIPSSSTLLNVLRNLGGAFGIAIIATLLDNDTRVHVSQITSTLAASSIEGQAYLMNLASAMQAQGSDPAIAYQQAQARLAGTIERDAAIMAYNKVFYVMGIFLLIASALVLFLKSPAPRASNAEPLEAH
ncbi:DHA2 family efflux MFS transporter permease subunit [Aeromonas sp. BIGb0445]|jgi:MFS transporter, DHA2 family, multidrug resistance protein|uniref:DHA2 family efflux MFS transporter permease subunit n=1 Tax=Aeromonas sp. BIGb0445 TaxID=2940593 RepID=UPI0021679F82|nr:DHA2 family efflux MFS transporter permease subunit [Aeromonas sp. BIGb0445]MCS3461612.1 DHA2 family multidrug resistance protein [Aeromonas sp. BIGb0445]